MQPLLDGLGRRRDRPAATGGARCRNRFARAARALYRLRLRETLAAQADTLDSDSRKRIEADLPPVSTRRSEAHLQGWIAMLDTLGMNTLAAPVRANQCDPPQRARRLRRRSISTGWASSGSRARRSMSACTGIGSIRCGLSPPRSARTRTASPSRPPRCATAPAIRNGTGPTRKNGPEPTTCPARPSCSAWRRPTTIRRRPACSSSTTCGRTIWTRWRRHYRVLFEAAGGGGLGLFTSIARLRAVHDRIAARLEHAGLTLYAQHIDAMDTGTLVDIFREETHTCLLGTDAVRDGVDVPGESLRLLVYDRVPWPRPDHHASRTAQGLRRQGLRRQHRAAEIASGLWPPDSPDLRSRRLRHARLDAAGPGCRPHFRRAWW